MSCDLKLPVDPFDALHPSDKTIKKGDEDNGDIARQRIYKLIKTFPL